jgi:hypothetical protein
MSIRYTGVADVSFTDYNGNSYSVKDIRYLDASDYETWFSVELKSGDDLDEIASRKNVYRDGGEPEVYRIIEHNIIALMDCMFDTSMMKSIKIPIP